MMADDIIRGVYQMCPSIVILSASEESLRSVAPIAWSLRWRSE